MSILRRRAGVAIVLLALVDLGGCAAIRHQFAQPSQDWQTRSGQLKYRHDKTTLIGDVLVRFSKKGDFELTFSKGPGVNLLALRQDGSNAEVRGAMAKMGWSGPSARAPKQLQGWLALREKIISAPDRKSLRYTHDSEVFDFRF